MCTKVVFSLESKMALFTFERYFGSCKASKPNFKLCCRLQKLCFQTNLKVHSLHLRFIEVLIWFVCTKVVFSLEIAFFAFQIRTGVLDLFVQFEPVLCCQTCFITVEDFDG